MELSETNVGGRAFFPMRGVEKKRAKNENNFFKMALAATMVALTTFGASAAGISITVGPSYRDHHRHHFTHHRVCHFDRFGYRHCFWR